MSGPIVFFRGGALGAFFTHSTSFEATRCYGSLIKLLRGRSIFAPGSRFIGMLTSMKALIFFRTFRSSQVVTFWQT